GLEPRGALVGERVLCVDVSGDRTRVASRLLSGCGVRSRVAKESLGCLGCHRRSSGKAAVPHGRTAVSPRRRCGRLALAPRPPTRTSIAVAGVPRAIGKLLPLARGAPHLSLGAAHVSRAPGRASELTLEYGKSCAPLSIRRTIEGTEP